MKKLVLIPALLVFAIGAFASTEDSYIYWMVPNNASGTEYGGDPLSGSSYTAKVRAIQGSEWTDTSGTLLDIYYAPDTGLGDKIGTSVSGITFGDGANNLSYFVSLATATVTTGSGWTYFVELYNDKGLLVSRSSDESSLPYSETSIVALSGLKAPGTAWAPMVFVPAPEPNSALLLLIGCAALALRRRRMQITA